MSDSDLLKRLINDRAIVNYSGSSLKLDERREKDCYLTIKDIPADSNTIAIKADMFKSPGSILKGNRGECSCADYIVISEKDKSILYIELKSGSTIDEPKVTSQLKGAECLVAYISAVGKKFWLRENFLDGYKERFAVAHDKKDTSKIQDKFDENKGGTADQPVRLRKNEEFQYRMLFGL